MSRSKFSILNGNNVLIGTNETWPRFVAARKAYYDAVDKAIAEGKPNDPLLGHPRPEQADMGAFGALQHSQSIGCSSARGVMTSVTGEAV